MNFEYMPQLVMWHNIGGSW